MFDLGSVVADATYPKTLNHVSGRTVLDGTGSTIQFRIPRYERNRETANNAGNRRS